MFKIDCLRTIQKPTALPIFTFYASLTIKTYCIIRFRELIVTSREKLFSIQKILRNYLMEEACSIEGLNVGLSGKTLKQS